MNTDDMSLEQAEQLLLALMDESEQGENMRKLYRFLRSIGIAGRVH